MAEYDLGLRAWDWGNLGARAYLPAPSSEHSILGPKAYKYYLPWAGMFPKP